MRKTARPFLSTFLLLFMSISSVYGQRIVDYNSYSEAYFDSIRGTVETAEEEYYIIQAHRLKETDEITIDGTLSESAWQEAPRGSGLLEKEPYPLIPMSEETEFAILYDDENIYIGVWCWDSEPEKIIHEITPRGTSGPDNLMLFLDTYNDRRSGYKFVVSPSGVQSDELRYDDIKRDANWNGVWQSAGSIDERGWYAEVKIPFFNLRFRDLNEQTWGFNIMRVISKDASRGQWKPHLPEWDNTTRMSQLGRIVGIRDINPGRSFELRPYSLAGNTETVDTGAAHELRLGADLRYSPTPNLTADLTLNPDFAQVDADILDINLTRFPTRFQELRPFFTERTNIFNTPVELFYSRRIGAGEDILGGAKITGKLTDDIEFGTLANITGQSVFSTTRQTTISSEGSEYGVFRMKKDISGSGNIGILAATKEQENSYNRVAGIDGSFVFNTHNLADVQIAMGQTEAGYKENMAYSLTYTRTGDLFGTEVQLERVEPFFEINRIGYIQKEPYRGWNRGIGGLRFSPRINQYSIRRITLNLELSGDMDLFTDRYIDTWLESNPQLNPDPLIGEFAYDEDNNRYILPGNRTPRHLSHRESLSILFLNQMTFSAEYQRFSATELTGTYSGDRWKVSYETRPLRLGTQFAGIFSLHGSTYYNFGQKYTGTQQGITLDGEGRLRYNIKSGLQGEITRTFDNEGEADGHYWKLSTNTSWMFTKDIYLRIHAQGLFGTTYYDNRRLYNQYLLSLLFSWEYRPGSYIYLAYNEGRVDEAGPFESRYFDFHDRTILLKLSYLLNI